VQALIDRHFEGRPEKLTALLTNAEIFRGE
jgi:hypothetical protein